MGKGKHLKLSALLATIPLEKFRFDTEVHNRQWRDTAGKRREFWLAEFVRRANPDGTFIRVRGSQIVNFSPSWARLEKHKSKTSVFRRTKELNELGLLSWDRANRQERRVYFIPPAVIEAARTFQTQSDNQNPDVSNSLVREESEVSRSRFEVSDSNPEVSDCPFSEVSVVKPIRLSSPPVSSPPPPPPEKNPEEKRRVGAVDYFFSQYKGKMGCGVPIPPTETERQEIQALEDVHGKKIFGRVTRRWFENRKLDGLNHPSQFFVREFPDTLAEIQREQAEQCEAQKLKDCMEEQARKRQAETQEQLKQAEQEHLPTCGGLFGGECSCQMEESRKEMAV